MLNDIKKELLKSPETLASVLEQFGYANIKISDTYMSFGRDSLSSPKSIVIRLHDNDYLYVKDYARNISKDLFSYIIDQRQVTFDSVMKTVKQCLGISDYYNYFQKRRAFNGFYDRIKKNNTASSPVKTYDKSILDPYQKIGNLRFLKDNISLESQKFFDIRYDIENNGIVIPILDQVGELMAIKERIDREPGPDEQKYWYLLPGRASKTLYGYSQNYNYLSGGTVLIFEAEKSCMQCFTYGIRNCVALGSGSISRDQIKMIYELQPSRVLFLHDAGYETEAILKNVQAFKNYSRFSEIEVGYWDWTLGEYKKKFSPSDLGKKALNRIINEEIKFIV